MSTLLKMPQINKHKP